MNEKNTFVAWLGFKGTPDFLKSRTIGSFVGVVSSIVLGLLVLLAILSLAGLLKSAFAFLSADNKMADPSTAIRNIGLMFAAIIGTPFVVWRSIVAQKQADIAEQGLITDRINKAVEGLGAEKTVKRHRKSQDGKLLYEDKEPDFGSDDKREPDFKKPIFDEMTLPNIEVRIGAIFSLERIAHDSPRDHIQIMEILSIYIRQNSPKSENRTTEIPKLRSDVSAALTVIGRRSKQQRQFEFTHRHDEIDLRDCSLSGFSGKNLNFSGVVFAGSVLSKGHFEHVSFVECILDGCDFDNSDLVNCDLSNSSAKRASFNGSVCENLVFSTANLFKAKFRKTQFEDANFFEVNIAGAEFDLSTFKSILNSQTVHLDRNTIKNSYSSLSFLLDEQMTHENTDGLIAAYGLQIERLEEELIADPVSGYMEEIYEYSPSYEMHACRHWDDWLKTRGFASEKIEQ